MTTKTVKRAGMILGGAASLALWAMVIVLACNGGGSSAPDASGSSGHADASPADLDATHSAPDSNPNATGDFTGGGYDSTVSGCQIISFVLTTTNGIVANPIGVNSNVHFTLNPGLTSVATATGLTLFSIQGHTCTMTIVPNMTPVTLSMHCSNTQGGMCDEVFKKQ